MDYITIGAKTIWLHWWGSIRNVYSGGVKGCGRSGRARDIGPVTIGRMTHGITCYRAMTKYPQALWGIRIIKYMYMSIQHFLQSTAESEGCDEMSHLWNSWFYLFKQPKLWSLYLLLMPVFSLHITQYPCWCLPQKTDVVGKEVPKLKKKNKKRKKNVRSQIEQSITAYGCLSILFDWQCEWMRWWKMRM